MEVIPVEEITLQMSYKEFNENAFLKLKNIIRQHGQLRSVLVMRQGKGYLLIEGSRIVRACIELNIKEVAAVIIAEIDESPLKEDAILRMMLNEDYFYTDFVELAILLKGLIGIENIKSLANRLPFEEYQIKALIKTLEFDFALFKNKKAQQDDKAQPTLF